MAVFTSRGKGRGLFLLLVGTIYPVVIHPTLITCHRISMSCYLVQKRNVCRQQQGDYKKGEAESMQTKCLRINTYKKSWTNFQESNLFCPTNMMRITLWKDLRGHPDHTRWPSDPSNIPKPVVPEKELDPSELILPLFSALPCLNLQWALKWI